MCGEAMQITVQTMGTCLGQKAVPVDLAVWYDTSTFDGTCTKRVLYLIVKVIIIVKTVINIVRYLIVKLVILA